MQKRIENLEQMLIKFNDRINIITDTMENLYEINRLQTERMNQLSLRIDLWQENYEK